jgi:hypothetical protein
MDSVISTTSPARIKRGQRKGWLRQVLGDIAFVARRERKIWLAPLILFLLLIAVLFGLASLAGPLAPFIYPLL